MKSIFEKFLKNIVNNPKFESPNSNDESKIDVASDHSKWFLECEDSNGAKISTPKNSSQDDSHKFKNDIYDFEN